MPAFYVNTETLSTESENLKTISDEVRSIASETLKILRKTKTSAASSIATLAKDTIVFASINLCAEEMESLSSSLVAVSEIYNNSEKSVIDKSFVKGTTTENPYNADGTDAKTAVFNGFVFREGDEIVEGLGFKVVEITDDGQILIERDTHILVDAYDFILRNPWLKAFAGPLLSLQNYMAKQTASDVKQKIIIETGFDNKTNGHYNNLGDFDKDCSTSFQKITYVSEGEFYKAEFEITPLDAGAGAQVGGIGESSWLNPASFFAGEAGAAAVNIKGNIRQGKENNNVNIGFDFDVASAGVDFKNGYGEDISFVDASGEKQTGTGYSQDMGASASAVSGRAYVQAVVNGVENTVAVTGGAGGVGGSGNIAITDSGFSAGIDAEVVAGLGFAISSVWGK